MSGRAQLLALAGALLTVAIVVHLIRGRRLREEYALFWLVAAGLLVVGALARAPLDAAAHLVGVGYGPTLLFALILAAGFFLAMHFSIALSRLAKQTTRLAQDLAALELRAREAPPAEPCAPGSEETP